jgi:hypothetical protein
MLRTLVAAEQAAAAEANGAFAEGLTAALGRAQLALGAVMSDPRDAGTMSPTATVAASANRALADAQALRETYC